MVNFQKMSASGEGEREQQRKKRAWRKPREPITPDPSGSLGSSSKPIKLQRRCGEGVAIAQEKPPSASAEQIHAVAVADCRAETPREKRLPSQDDQPTAKVKTETEPSSSDTAVGGGATEMPVGGVATDMEVDKQGLPLISIDGSVMEGVR